MIYQPRNVTPTKKSVDIRILDQYFTMEISTNSSVIAYKLFLLDWNNDTRYTGDIEYLDTPLYNGDTLYIEIPHPTLNNYDFISNGNDYKWYVYLYQDETNMLITNGIIQDVEQSIYLTLQQNINILPGMYFKYGEDLIEILNYDPLTGKVTLDEAPTLTPTVGTTYSIYSNFIKTTPEYILYARETPVVTITNPPTTLTTKSYTFNATYSQANDEPIISHRWIIGIPIDGGGGSFEKIYDSGDIYNANLSFTYDAFRNGINYLIELEVTSTYENIGYSGFQYFNVEYQTLEYLEKPMAKLDCNKNAIQIDWVAPTEFSPTLIDNDIYSGNINTILAAKVEGSGTSITLDDTAGDIPMDIDLASSELSQETTTGKNKLGYTLASLKTSNILGTWNNNVYTYRNVTFTVNDDLSITINGTASEQSLFYLINTGWAYDSNYIISQGTYTINNISINPNTFFCLNLYKTDNTNVFYTSGSDNVTFNVNETMSLSNPRLVVNATTTANNYRAYPQLESGSSATSWEKPTGGLPAPNPSFPMPIHTISGNNKVVVEGKNLWKFTKLSFTPPAVDWYDVYGNKNMYTVSNFNNSPYKITLPAGTYYMSYSDTQNIQYIQLMKAGDSALITVLQENEHTFTLTEETEVLVRCRCLNANVQTSAGYIQIEKGNQATPYTPYVSQEANINLGDIEYCEIGNYKDEFVRSSGNNLFDKDNVNVLNAYIDSTNGNIGNSNNTRAIYIPCKANTSYTISKIVSPRFIVGLTSTLPANGVTCLSFKRDDNATHLTLEGNANAKYLVVYLTNNYDSNTWNNIINSLMINEGTTALPYEPYGIGNWGIRKNIGKVVLDGSETGWGKSGASTSSIFVGSLNLNQYGININNKFATGSQWLIDRFTHSGSLGGSIGFYTYNGNQNVGYANLALQVDATTIPDIDTFKAWLGNNNTTVYYIHNTPEYTPITGTLAEQLENIYQYLLSYKGQTNILQINNDLPFVISASAYKYVDIPENSFYIQKNLQNIIPGYNIIISNVLFTISNYNAATGLMTVEENIPYKINMGGDVYTISGVADIPIGSAVTLLRNTPYSGVNSVDTGNYSLIYEDEDSESGLGEYPENYNITLQFKPDASFFYGTEGIFNDINPIAFIESDAPDGVTGMIIIFIHQYNVCAGKPQLSSGVANIQQLGANNTQNMVHLAEDINITNTPYIYFTNYGYVEKVNSYNTTTKMATLNKNLPFALEAGEDYVMLETLTATFYSNPQDAFALQTNRNPQSNLDYRWIDNGNQWEDSKYWVEGGTGIERVAGNWWKLQITNNTIKLEKGGN